MAPGGIALGPKRPSESVKSTALTAGATRMFREAAEAPEVMRAQLVRNAPIVQALAERLRANPPRAVVTFGRGSSDHAATFVRYLIETRLGVVTSSAAPSVSSVYDASPGMEGMLSLVISQPPRTPDLLPPPHPPSPPPRLPLA